MRIKKEIIDLIKCKDTTFFINQDGSSNKWYIASSTLNGVQASNGGSFTAYGGFPRGSGTFRNSKKSMSELHHEKTNKGYIPITPSQFIERACDYGMFSLNDLVGVVPPAPKKEKINTDQLEAKRMKLNPSIPSEVRQKYIERLNAF